jgi:YebC/PmpR family DNA-binding regulatory protein
MAGHSKWKNIQRTKGANDLARAKEFTKLARAIEIAAQSGIDPKLNPTLADAITRAKKQNLPKEKIEKAIQNASGNLKSGVRLEKITYEGYGPHNIMLMVDCLTDNRNRTITDLRTFFGKNGGRIVETGAISWKFQQVGIIDLTLEIDNDTYLKIIEVDGVLDILPQGVIYTIVQKLDNVRRHVETFTEVKNFQVGWKCLEDQEFSELDQKDIDDFIQKLEEIDDVDEVWR